eukprot:1159156-Pelagomonas_calceolata.AAC.12
MSKRLAMAGESEATALSKRLAMMGVKGHCIEQAPCYDWIGMHDQPWKKAARNEKRLQHGIEAERGERLSSRTSKPLPLYTLYIEERGCHAEQASFPDFGARLARGGGKEGRKVVLPHAMHNTPGRGGVVRPSPLCVLSLRGCAVEVWRACKQAGGFWSRHSSRLLPLSSVACVEVLERHLCAAFNTPQCACLKM